MSSRLSTDEFLMELLMKFMIDDFPVDSSQWNFRKILRVFLIDSFQWNICNILKNTVDKIDFLMKFMINFYDRLSSWVFSIKLST